MSGIGGESFLVLPPCTESSRKQIIFGRAGTERQTDGQDEVTEVVYYPGADSVAPVTLDGGCEIEGAESPSYAVILSKPAGRWGAESGSNEKAVAIGLSHSDGTTVEGKLTAPDLVRLTLERSDNAPAAIDQLVALVERYGPDRHESLRAAFVICDPSEVWLLNVAGHLWAAHQVTDTGLALSASGLTIGSKFERSTADLAAKAQEAGAWDGTGDFSFSASFGAAEPAERGWPANEPAGEGSFSLKHMFECLRAAGGEQRTGACQVSVLTGDGGLSCHWFTATPHAIESVFKPFIFTPGAKISPLTRVPDGEMQQTLLHRLHGNRKWDAVGSLLSSLEATCVDEVDRFLGEHSGEPNQELDELMKDCVEAEVKFYR